MEIQERIREIDEPVPGAHYAFTIRRHTTRNCVHVKHQVLTARYG